MTPMTFEIWCRIYFGTNGISPDEGLRLMLQNCWEMAQCVQRNETIEQLTAIARGATVTSAVWGE